MRDQIRLGALILATVSALATGPATVTVGFSLTVGVEYDISKVGLEGFTAVGGS